jgi:LysM domain.
MRFVLPLLLLLTTLLAACSTVSLNPAPVVSKNFTPVGAMAAQGSAAPLSAASAAAAAANAGPYAAYAGQPGYYTVQAGDTVRRIGQQFGQDWRSIVSWNNLSDPNVIEVGQVLRVAPPVAGTPSAVAALTAAQAPLPANGQVAQSYPLAPITASTPVAPAVPPVVGTPSVASSAGMTPALPPSCCQCRGRRRTAEGSGQQWRTGLVVAGIWKSDSGL